MTEALADAGVPADVEIVMREFLGGIATFLMNKGESNRG